MVEFLPFKALLPVLSQQEKMVERISPPYDVISPEELKRWQAHRHNVTRITLGAIDGDYLDAGRTLDRWVQEDVLSLDGQDSYYLYDQEFLENGKRMRRRGIVGILAAAGYDPNGVIPHEETFSKVKEDRLNLLRGTETHCESIFGIFDKFDTGMEKKMEGLAEEVSRFTDPSGVFHVLKRIADPSTVERLRTMFSGKRMLIADGHHRYETACKYSQENPSDPRKGFVLATLVSSGDPGMIVRPTHRLISGMGMSEEQLVQSLSSDFALAKMPDLNALITKMKESNGHDLGLAMRSGTMLLLRPKRDGRNALENLDTFVCEESIIKPLVLARDAKVAYDHDLDSVIARLKSGEFEQAVLLSPPSLQLIWDVALSGQKMPKKSTYFWPKMWSGLLYYRMK